jgi:hypothetical protein
VPLGPVNLALLLSCPLFVGRRIVHEGNSRVRNLGVLAAIVADERCPRLATQYFVEFDPGRLQLAQSPGGSCYPVIVDGSAPHPVR